MLGACRPEPPNAGFLPEQPNAGLPTPGKLGPSPFRTDGGVSWQSQCHPSEQNRTARYRSSGGGLLSVGGSMASCHTTLQLSAGQARRVSKTIARSGIWVGRPSNSCNTALVRASTAGIDLGRPKVVDKWAAIHLTVSEGMCVFHSLSRIEMRTSLKPTGSSKSRLASVRW